MGMISMATGTVSQHVLRQAPVAPRYSDRRAATGLVRQTAGLVLVTVAAVLGACATSEPAPVVNRTGTPGTTAPPAIGTAPTATLPAAGAQPPAPVTMLPPQEPTGAEVNPIRSNALGSGTNEAGQGGDPNLKTGPRGLKRPFGELASVDPRRAGSSSAPVNQAPQPVSTLPAAPAAMPPAVVASAKPPGGSGVLDGISFDWPLKGTLVQGFNDTSGKGVSLEAKSGTTVAASADGKVIFSGAGPKGYGNLVIVKHSSELLSVYANNRSLAVKEGESVKRGQKIAEVGAEKGATPQLHFEIRQQGKPIDPIGVLPAR